MAKKKVAAALVSSLEAFLMVLLALQVEVPTTAASIPRPKVGKECWNFGLDGAVVTSI
jgi:hypothetical protein